MEDIIVEDLEITIQGDDEGDITFECPFCKSEFKLRADECQNDETPYDEYFCPYCGLVKDKNEFLSEDIIEQVKAIAMNELIEELNKSFSNMSRFLFTGYIFILITDQFDFGTHFCGKKHNFSYSCVLKSTIFHTRYISTPGIPPIYINN